MSYPIKTDFSDRTVCITGATSGIGLACAMAFAQAGAKIVATGRRTEKLHELKAACPKPDQVYTIKLDATDREAVMKTLQALPSEFQNIDILINNAGLAMGQEKAAEAALDDWEVMIDTNVKGAVYAVKAVLPGMIARGRGHIINLGSVAGSYSYPGGNVYGATKAFLKQFSLNLRADLLGHPIRVTDIEPGMVKTDFSLVRFKGDAERADSVYAGVDAPLTAEDVAQSVFWVASLPEHFNINRVEMMPVAQAFGPLAVHRKPLGTF